MGNSYAGQLKTTRFEEVLHNSIEASLRSSTVAPRPVFSQLYLEAEQQITSVRAGRAENEEEDEDESSESSSPPIPYLMKPPPQGCCTTDGFCQSGKDLRLGSLSLESLEVPPGFLLVGAKSPSLPEHLLVCAVDRRFLPDESGRNALLGFSGNCIGCGENFRYFTEFSNHINLKLTTQPKKQKHLKYYLFRNTQGTLAKGALICWKGTEGRVRQLTSNTCLNASPAEEHSHLGPVASAEPLCVLDQNAAAPGLYTGLTSDLPPLVSGTSAPLYSSREEHSAQQTQRGSGTQPPQNTSRPSVIGTITNSGPPKKRHKGWSPESPSPADPLRKSQLSGASNGTKTDSEASGSLPQLTPGSTHSSPLLTPGETVTVPDNLLTVCRTQPVIFKGHGNLPYLCGNVKDVIVSSLLQSCYRSSQALPRVYEQYGTSPVQPLSVEMQILLTVYYLVQLAPDQMPLIEDLEQIFMRSWRESHLTEIRQYQQTHPQLLPQALAQVLPVTLTQLPWLAKLAASSCNDSVRVVDCAHSLADGLTDTLRALVEGQLDKTNFVVIICTAKSREAESCLVVTGRHQARALAESMYTPAECLQEISYELVTGKAAALGAFFSTLCPEGDVDSLLDKFSADGKAQVGLSNNLSSSEGTDQGSCSEFQVKWQEIRPIQLAVARKLLSHVCAIADSSSQNLDLGSFGKVEFLIFVPPSEVTFQQVVMHLWNSGILLELGLEKELVSKKAAEQYVVKLDLEAREKINTFIQMSQRNPYTLFILVHDHAHWDMSSGPLAPGDSYSGLVDELLNCREISEAPNILTLHVTSFPFGLQTQLTRISPYNEVHWPSAYNNDVDLYHESTKYFGLSELLDSTRSGHGLPLLRYDSSFEAVAMSLEERFPRLHSGVIRTYVLIQHYAVALMVVSGRSQLRKHTSVETLEMLQGLVSAPQQCPCGHGHMVLLRIPSPPLASVAFERLCRVRERLGLQNRFEIILGNGSSELSVGKHFLEQLKMWLKIQDANWVPQTYLELEALPCILIFTGMDPQGESLPRSLKYCDLRLINSTCLMRTALEQELGLAAYLVTTEQCGERAAVSDLSESDPEKMSSTDNEEEEVVVDALSSVNRSPVKRQRSFSHDSASSSSSLKTSTCSDTGAEKPGHNPLPSQAPNPPDSAALKLGQQTQQQVADRAVRGASEEQANPCTPHDGQRRPSKSKSASSASSSSTRNSAMSQSGRERCSWARCLNRPPVVFLPKAVYDVVVSVDSGGLPKSTSFLPHLSVSWASSFRPLLSKMMTCTEQSLYYRQWTLPKQTHMDSSNRAEGRTDNFHPRRLLLSGPPQVGKTGAYMQFLGILSRMLIRLMEIDIYDEEDINFSVQEGSEQYHPQGAAWPAADILESMPFDYTVHDPKYDDISPVFSPGFAFSNEGSSRKQDDVYLRRRTTRIKLSKYAAYNSYHHCEQCHQYMGFNPRFQLYESTLHAFTFSYLMLGEEIQLYFIIPKSKEHYFAFSQPGGQLESMRLPLTSSRNPDGIKSPIFTPTTGRHEHGLFNLYHAMDGASHLHVLVVKEYEMAVYKKYWPNHIMLVLPTIFNGAGVGAAHFLIKELSYHNLELERHRQAELGVRPQEVWPFIVLADDSCVMWNAVHSSTSADGNSAPMLSERNVSLKRVLQHMEATPGVAQYGLCGMRKWSSRGGAAQCREPFSRCHLHDLVLLNVDLTQNVQYNQHRFTCDDVDFNLRAHSAGLLLCRFNSFSVMKKQIPIGGHRTFIIKSKVTDVPTTVPASQYTCAPDSKHTFLSAPPQLLLEKYLQHSGQRLFPLSLTNHGHPVLSVDCYLNLGPEVTVCYVSSRPHSVNVGSAGMLFSGLLLYGCDSFVTAGFIKSFHFLKGATLCVICQDRNSLRQTVGRLELEEEWRFRLRDEFQTANCREDKPLFFLTGKHV
ncbi:protein GREB1 isoform X2 [Amia ocellicauda]|uniref:protein GREB1 isoform X2 n=1 Tax=Amia ocellicauda TaxID=2972642 RepID=UPI003464066A